jgi:hypothetical protein
MKIILLSFFFVLLDLFESSIQAQRAFSAQQCLKLGIVENQDMGCGCSFALNKSDLRNHRDIFIQEFEEPAYINLNGNKLKLQVVDSSPEKNEDKLGKHSWKTFAAGNLKVQLDMIVTKVCDPKDESCEVTYYNATMTVSRKAQKTAVKLIGLCGC